MKEGEDEEERSRGLKNDRSRESRDKACLNRTSASLLARFVPLRPIYTIYTVWIVCVMALDKRYIKVSQGLPLPPSLSPTAQPFPDITHQSSYYFFHYLQPR